MMRKAVCFLAYDEMELLDLAGPQTAFHEANQFHSDSYKLQVIGFDTATVTCEAGLQVVPSASLDEIKDCHTLIVPGGRGARSTNVKPEHLAKLSHLMARCERVVSICTGVYLTARAGLPDKTNVATHWAFVSDLSSQYPALKVESEKLFVQDGRYWSSAGVTAGIDLTLRLIELDTGKATAHHVAKHMVVYLQRTGSQKQYSDVLDVQAPKNNRIEFITNWIKQHIGEDITVERLAEKIHLSERQCHRLFLKETNLTPAQYVEKCRMQMAGDLLATSEQELKTIASIVGFSTYDGFRRAFERNYSVTPSMYRQSFLAD